MYRIIIITLIIIGIDLYVFRTFQNQIRLFSYPLKDTIYLTFWSVPFFLLSITLYFAIINDGGNFLPGKLASYLVGALVLFYLPKLFIIFFQLIEDFGKVGAWFIKKLSQPESFLHVGADKVLKSVVVGRLGLIISIIPFIAVIYGVIHGKYNFTVKEVNLYFENLPAAFNGFKIIQFSDFHSGSLSGRTDKYKKAIDLINQQNADIVVFTGDIVNTSARELDDWIDIISEINGKQGKYSILGNHDYGDYARWESDSAKSANLELLKQYHKQMGFRLLLNESVKIERDSQSIALLGVENWGERPFPKHGRLDLALQNSVDIPFKILLSHDPTHWEHEVKGKTDIALTLSGHTHGMQMAMNIGSFSWSPVSLKYPRWKGLYNENGQYLYINLGLGYIGFPGRFGANPEITVINLWNNKDMNATVN